VYRVTANTALNLAKKRQLEKERFFEFDDKLDVPDESLKTSDAAGREDAHERVEGLLGLLNTEQRACVVLRNIEGLSYQEIAQALKVNINTVRTRLKRAREKMAEYMKNRGDVK
jgi:RNA polymerase sigma-70 factor, ECF subfamily